MSRFYALPILVVANLLAAPPCGQFTGQRVTLDRRYPTDTKVPSKYGTQVVGKEGAKFLAGIRCLSSLPIQVNAALRGIMSNPCIGPIVVGISVRDLIALPHEGASHFPSTTGEITVKAIHHYTDGVLKAYEV